MPLRILIVDDEPVILNLLERCLAPDYEVHSAENGQIAERMFDRIQPHLVLTDIIMPVKDGIETVVSLRAKDKNVKVIVISAASNKLYLDTTRALGADEILVKPLDLDQVRESVDRLLSHERSQLALAKGEQTT